MESVKLSDIKHKINYYHPIGMGSSAICFMMKDGMVYKHYFNNSQARFLIDNKSIDFRKRMEILSTLDNDTFYAPLTLVLKDDDLIDGYIMRKASGKTINKMNKNLLVKDVLEDLKVLIDEVYSISDKQIRLGDLHDHNILYDGKFRIIDLDKGSKMEKSYTNISIFNVGDIIFYINHAILGVNSYYDIHFYNHKIRELYGKALCDGYDAYVEYLKAIDEYLRLDNPRLRDYRKAGILLYEKSISKDYYGL